jgi:hypothetical protein
VADEFFITPYRVRSAGTDVPPEEVQAAINSLAQQVTVDLNLLASGTLPLNAVTQNPLDNSTLVATDAFVNQQNSRATATVPFAVTGGLYNQASRGSGAQIVIFASGGVVSGVLTISNPGSGYAVGDLLILAAGNYDAIVRVTGVSGSGITSVGIPYGGTGYTTGVVAAAVDVPPGRRTVTFTGVLTSNVTFVIQNGTYNTASRQVEFNNNTTGAFTLTVFLSNGAGGTTGNGVVLPQGTNNSTAILLQTDGVNDVWPAVSLLGEGTANFGVAFLAYFNSLPTTLPGTAGVIWNNGGTLSQS